MKSQDTYGAPTTYQLSGWKINVYRPILTDEERARRMKEIEKAAAALLMEVYKREKRMVREEERP